MKGKTGQAEAMFKYTRSGGLRGQTVEGEQPRGRSKYLHIESPDVDKLAEEVRYPSKHKAGKDQLAMGGDGKQWQVRFLRRPKQYLIAFFAISNI
jgi:hypothetical protein